MRAAGWSGAGACLPASGWKQPWQCDSAYLSVTTQHIGSERTTSAPSARASVANTHLVARARTVSACEALLRAGARLSPRAAGPWKHDQSSNGCFLTSWAIHDHSTQTSGEGEPSPARGLLHFHVRTDPARRERLSCSGRLRGSLLLQFLERILEAEGASAATRRHLVRAAGAAGAAVPPPRTKWTRRVPYPVLIGHAAAPPVAEALAAGKRGSDPWCSGASSRPWR